MKPNEDELRKEFEDWFEADAMPLEANWFKRDEQFPDIYAGDYIEHAWGGFKAGYERALFYLEIRLLKKISELDSQSEPPQYGSYEADKQDAFQELLDEIKGE